jgi:hypothetical protein
MDKVPFSQRIRNPITSAYTEENEYFGLLDQLSPHPIGQVKQILFDL